MRRINKWYILAIILWLICSSVVLYFDVEIQILSALDTGLILGVISVTISILSLGLSSMNKPKFRGKITCWNVKSNEQHVNNSNSNPIGIYSCITFKIDNKGKKPIKDLIINFRFPSKIYHRSYHDNYLSYFQFKETIIVTSEHLKFLGSSSGDCELVLEHLLNISAWDKNRVIYVTISGNDIQPTTFKLDFSMSDSILNSDSKHPINPFKV